MPRYIPTVRREDYQCREDYLRALHEAGGPSPAELRAGDCDVTIWGKGDFGDIALAELRDEQRRRRHLFRLRWRGGRRPRRP